VALRLVDRGGLEALSMRSVAHALRTGPMTLYNHVRDRSDLESLLVDAVMAELGAQAPRARHWQGRVEQLVLAMWRAVRAHPQLVALILTRKSRSAESLDFAEALLSALSEGGFEGARLRRAFRLVSALVAGFAQAELHGPFESEATQAPSAALAGRYKHLAQLARGASRDDASAQLRAGLRALLAGI
jgi:AcrR family transcriptional regulator